MRSSTLFSAWAASGPAAFAFVQWLFLAAIVGTTERYFKRECRPFGVLRDTASVKEWHRQLEVDRARMAELRAVWDPIHLGERATHLTRQKGSQ